MPKGQGGEILLDTYRYALPHPLATCIAASHEALTTLLQDHCGAGLERVKKATHGDRGKVRRLEKEMATHSSILVWKTVHGVAKS